jgi:dihydropteroate synthase
MGGVPKLMGIVNVTPDSFSDGGSFLHAEKAVEHALQLVNDGADLLDVGGESSRPGAAPIPTDVEMRRVLPVIHSLVRQTSVPISIDTTKASVARSALDAGAAIVNDISALTWDPSMPAVCAQAKAGVICMHCQGTPMTMQQDPHYQNVVEEVAVYLAARIRSLEEQGIDQERIVVDPGIGFGKTAAHNLEILRDISRFQAIGRPILIGHSRKGFLQKILGRPIDERLAGTIGVSVAVALAGANVLRVHDVRATRDALVACWKILK